LIEAGVYGNYDPNPPDGGDPVQQAATLANAIGLFWSDQNYRQSVL